MSAISKKEIPFRSAGELWQAHCNPEAPAEELFPGPIREFLVVRMEDFPPFANLPTPPHRRDVCELIVVTGGRVQRTIDLQQVSLPAAALHLALPGQVLTFTEMTPDIAGFYCHFSPALLARLYQAGALASDLDHLKSFFSNGALPLDAQSAARVVPLLNRLHDAYRVDNDFTLIDAYLVALIREVRALTITNGNARANKNASPLPDRFKALVARHIHESQRISFYARCLNVSPNHLNKVVKSVTGKPARALIAEMVVLEARVLLLHSALSVSEIAFRLGFEDSSYFSRFFRKMTGTTPRVYRTGS